MARIGWIDFSKKDRQKAEQLLSLIRPEGQLDELGVGYLRDALANHLFPGISTIQTRAKYFFIIPHILRDYRNLSPTEKRGHRPIRDFLKEKENQVKNKLKETYNNQEGKGIIGVTLRPGQYIKRNASEIYWGGLQTFGFMNPNHHSLDQYLRNMAAEQPVELSRTDIASDDAFSNYENMDTIFTPVNKDWFEDLRLSLDKQESDFFRSQIIHTGAKHPHAVLPQLFRNDKLLEAFLNAGNFQEFVLSSRNLNLKQEQVKSLLELAYDFALLMEGVHLLYNHLLQEHFFKKDYKDEFKHLWIKWRSSLKSKMIDYSNFDSQHLFDYPQHVRNNSVHFINRWCLLIRQSAPKSNPSKEMQELVRQREFLAKGKKARLSKAAAANTDIQLNTRIGLSLFQYRFSNAKIITEDIISPDNE